MITRYGAACVRVAPTNEPTNEGTMSEYTIPPDHRFVETEYVCTATSCEQHMLWEKWSEWYRVPWQEVSLGLMATIGHLDDRPIAVSVTWAFVGTRRVAFVDATSQLVDWLIVDEWRQAVFPNCKQHSDATNFGNLVSAIGRQVGTDLIRRSFHDVMKLQRGQP